MRRIIREQEPQRPSTRLSTLEDADLTAVANHRRSEPPKLLKVLRQQGKLAEVEATYREIVEIASAEDLNRLAWDLATSDNPEIRDGKIAVLLAEKAIALTDRKDPRLLDTLATAYAEAGQFEKAVSAQKEAIALLKDEENKTEFISRLKLFESNTPYREKD